MQLTLQALFAPASEGNAVLVETNAHATVQTLISAFCSQKGVDFSSKYVVLDESRRPLPLYSTLQSAGVTSGQKLYIAYKENYSWKVRWPLYIAVFALVIGLIGILTMSLVYSLFGGVIPFDYGIVMDAGSSKTKTLFYHWKGNKYKGTGCVEQVDTCTVRGGLGANPDPTINKILQCAAKVTEPVKEKSKPNTVVYFAATAGLRLLKLTDPEAADKLLSRMRTRLKETGMTVKGVDIISGATEGIAGWITTNFLKETLDIENNDPWKPITYGALDLGGASTQVSYSLPPDEVRENRTDMQKLTLFGQEHNVFSVSYLCFGRDQAQRRYHRLLVKDPSAKRINDPCAPRGYEGTHSAEYLFGHPCTQSAQSAKWKETYKDSNYTFVGTSDYESCASRVAELTDTQACLDKGFRPCFDDNLPRQLDGQKFVAFANYFYTTDFLKLTKSTLEEYMNGTKNFCRKPLKEIHAKEPFNVQYCFNAVYIHQLLISGFKFNSTTWKNVEFLGEVDGKELGWSLGYMLNATNLIPEKGPTKRLIAPGVLIVCLLIFITTVVATIIYIGHTLRRRKTFSTGHPA